MKLYKTQQSIYFCIILFFIGILTRIPYMGKFLYFWDSANYALGMENYNVAKFRPNPPGYFLYIYLAKFFNLFFTDVNFCLVIVNVLASGVGAVFLYLFCRKVFSPRIAIVSSLLFLSSPVIWFHGETALAYMFDGAVIMVFAYFAYNTLINPRLLNAVITGVLFAICVGIRQQSGVLLLPLYLYSIHKCRIRHVFLSLLSSGLVFFCWFIPMVSMSEGLKGYLSACKKQGGCGLHGSFVEYFGYLKMVGKKFIKAVAKFVTVGMVPLGIVVGMGVFGKLFFKRWMVPATGTPLSLCSRNVPTWLPLWFFAFWIIPCIIFWLIFHLGNVGHMFTCMFPIFPAAALSLYIISKKFKNWKKVFEVLTVFCVLVNIIMFFIDEAPNKEFKKKTWYKDSDVRKRSDFMEQKIKYIKENFSPSDTVVLANTGGNGHLQQASYYLRGYDVYHFNSLDLRNTKGIMHTKGYNYVKVIEKDTNRKIFENIKNIVLFDKGYFKYLKNKELVREVYLDKNVVFYYVPVEENDRIVVEVEYKNVVMS